MWITINRKLFELSNNYVGSEPENDILCHHAVVKVKKNSASLLQIYKLELVFYLTMKGLATSS